MFQTVVVLAALVATVSAHTVHMGRTCPDVEPYTNLSMDKVLGIWYVVYAFDTNNKCLVWNITKVDDDTFKLTESRQLHVLDALSIDHKHDLTATLDLPNPEIPGRMRIRWPTSLTGKADFTIFDTDYQDYMAVFECDRAGLLHRRNVAILSRASVMDQMFVDRIRRKLDTAGVPHDALHTVEHNVCRDEGKYEWHTDGELFGLLKSDDLTQEQRLRAGVQDYDLSQIEILQDGIEDSNQFKGSLKVPRSV